MTIINIIFIIEQSIGLIWEH